MTMGSNSSRESGQPAAAPIVVDLTVPEPVTPPTVPVAAAGRAVPAAATGDLPAPDQGKNKKRKVDESASADEEDTLLSSSSSSPRAAKRAKVEEEEGAEQSVPSESIFGGPAGPRRHLPPRAPANTTADDDEVIFVSSHPRLKRGRQEDPVEVEEDDEEDAVVFLREAKRARTTSPSEVDACTIDLTRGMKRRADAEDDSDDDVVLVSSRPVKRLRTNDTTSPVEAADEEVARADLPLSAADVVRAASPADGVTRSGLVSDNGVAKVEGAATEDKLSFMSLPYELREMIYRYALVAPKPVVPRVANIKGNYRIGFPIGGRVTSLLVANRQIGREALYFLLRENVFKLSIKHHRAWLNTIKRANSSLLRHIVVDCDGKNKHALDNLVAFQNTLRKRVGGDQLLELTYQFNWSMDGQSAIRMFDEPQFQNPGWKKTWKRLESVTVDVTPTRGSNNGDRLLTEETQRNLSRLCLDLGGVPVVGRLLRTWRRDKKSLPWCRITLKDGWEKHCTKNRRETGNKWVPQRWDKWSEIVAIEVIPPTFD